MPSRHGATIAFSTVFTKLIDLLHSPAADPNALKYVNAHSPCRSAPSLPRAVLSLAQLLADNKAAKTRVFWEVKKVATEKFLDVYDEADTPAEKLDNKAHLHLAAWLARLITLAGGTLANDGTVVIGKLEAHLGGPGGGFAPVKDFSVLEARQRRGAARWPDRAGPCVARTPEQAGGALGCGEGEA
ncbi:hypothetical protein EVJ58_g9148 [Rhodofomes roseus]|uniref:Uncharacterized protein n=1 Tax=Rhodofomes roseus TaxID=34475 RepID=A0A4Y9XUJ7_9APHY|nr:hypothetical protein EVJ58_g9148 [Rhodofomes roseus]